ncbi:MAG TPA: EpsI family protein, partial [Emticicia sp.]
VLLASGLTVAASKWMQPSHDYMQGMPNLETLIPKQFGDWHEVQDASTQISVSPYQKGLLGQIYDDVLMRSYEDADGHRIMLAIAYAHEQKQEIKVHRPEVCYKAQGFDVLQLTPVIFPTSNKHAISGKTMIASDGSRYETVSYWVRMGDKYPSGGLEARKAVLLAGLVKNTVIDGVLVRVSMSSNDLNDKNTQFEYQRQFLGSLINSLNENDQKWLIAM